jgi:hypothetical protein
VAALDSFQLGAEISLTELRSEKTVTERLRTHHRLQVRRRHEVVGVFLDVQEWRELVRHVTQLEAEAEQREDEAARAVIAARAPGALFESGSAERVAEIDRAYEELVAKRSDSRGKRR